MASSYDTVVIGGGPAGSCAAAAVGRRSDRDVLLVERGVHREDREGPGPDSTCAGGFVDYWVDVAGWTEDDLGDVPILRTLDRIEFISPGSRVALSETPVGGSYPHAGFTFDRVALDDRLLEEARRAGAECTVGCSVTDVATDLQDDPSRHTVTLDRERRVTCRHLILADGPHRPITRKVLRDLVRDPGIVDDRLDPGRINHVGYQEYRRFPEDLAAPKSLRLFWGFLPGRGVYLWMFPNRENVVRVGVTHPASLRIASEGAASRYPLLEPGEKTLPDGPTLIRRLLKHRFGDHRDPDRDFPRVEDRGKNRGREGYAISSCPPIDSPVGAGVLVAGGAMGTTSVFHEGGYHTAVRTGRLAGTLVAEDRVEDYNRAWREAVGPEILRNLAGFRLVRGYRCRDWDRVFSVGAAFLRQDESPAWFRFAAWLRVIVLWVRYEFYKWTYGDDYGVLVKESEYRPGASAGEPT